MYSIAASYFDPKEIVSIDIDSDALELARSNIEHYELEEQIKVIEADLMQLILGPEPQYNDYFDTILMNPPFGTKNNEGVDMKLLQCCVKALKPGGVVFSLHKDSTSKYIQKYV